MRVLVFGSRTFDDSWPIRWVLDGLHEHSRADRQERLTLIEGGAPGADAIAASWADEWEHAVDHEQYEADWTGPCRPECSHGLRRRRRDGAFYCPAAGNYRNERQLREGRPDVAWGFVNKPLELSTGSLDMATRLKEAGVETYIVQKLSD